MLDSPIRQQPLSADSAPLIADPDGTLIQADRVHDPLVFAVKDRASLLAGSAFGAALGVGAPVTVAPTFHHQESRFPC
jgi:hypothetical protein